MVHRVMPMVKNATGAAAAAAGCGDPLRRGPWAKKGKSWPINAIDGAQLKHPKSESNHRVPPVFTPLSIKNIWNASIRQWLMRYIFRLVGGSIHEEDLVEKYFPGRIPDFDRHLL
jgi:hypothetical protein